jgi:NAD(P)H-hydrate repair Nnr-like enzyme with NAD(P)H-hydrate dehydratase domain
VLAAQAAYRVGAGLVTVAAPQTIIPMLASHITEATWILLPHDMGVINEAAVAVLRKELGGYSAMLLGPGIGQEDATQEFIEAFLVREKKGSRSQRRMGFAVAAAEAVVESDDEKDSDQLPPMVIDADALNLLAKMDEWWTRLPTRSIVTPHPGEMARLAKIEDETKRKATEIVQSNRLGLAAESAAKWNCVVVLKGAHTVIADPDGRVAVTPFANAALARAGTGDVLAGAVAGYLAQGLDPFDAAVTATYVHGYAGELAASYMGTKASVVAGDIVATLADSISAVETAE